MHSFDSLVSYCEKNGIGFKLKMNVKGWSILLFDRPWKTITADTLDQAIGEAIHVRIEGSQHSLRSDGSAKTGSLSQ